MQPPGTKVSRVGTKICTPWYQSLPITIAGRKPLVIEPDSDDISEYLEGGSWWESLAGDVSNVAKKAAKGVEKPHRQLACITYLGLKPGEGKC